MPFFLETDGSLDLEIMPVRAGNYGCACVRASTMSVEGGGTEKDVKMRSESAASPLPVARAAR